MFELLGNVMVNCELPDFIDAVDIWCLKPHVVNRRLAGCVIVAEELLSSELGNLNKHEVNEIDSFKNNEINFESLCASITDIMLCNLGLSCSNGDARDQVEMDSDMKLQNLLTQLVSLLLVSLPQCDRLNYDPKESEVHCKLRKLIPRNIERYNSTYELVVSCQDLATVPIFFIPLFTEQKHSPLISKSYCVKFDARKLCMQYFMHKNFDADVQSNGLVASKSWILENLVVKLKNWSETSFQSNSPLRKSQSLSLIDIEEYTVLYTELKKKYGPYFIQIWPESTDPLKFVYEDIAIATYLLLIWKNERRCGEKEEMQSFVDLGCGNGLLVHILSSEGHQGKGIDIAKRKIWSLYGETTILKEEAIYPDIMVVEEDWIIGNHSDELTPWIPVIAARSSYTTKYFVLPCCFYDFHSKFRRVNKAKPQYEQYLEYIYSIGQKCGFIIERDTLRIPSTKRICQIGKTRSYPAEAQSDINEVVANITKGSGQSDADFKPRDTEISVRNCTQVDATIRQQIIDTITEKLLSAFKSHTDISYNQNNVTSSGDTWQHWNSGGSMHVKELVQLFDEATLKNLKAQCGGLQTLLKNNRHIFKVVGGLVCFRDYRNPLDLLPSRKSVRKSKSEESNTKVKSKMCWFFVNHPNGCVLTTESCKFAHGNEDLR